MGDIFTRKALKQTRQRLRNRMTAAEKVVWNCLRRERINGARFRRQSSIGSFVVDFYCPKLLLAIEIDGDIHKREDIKKYDRFREKCIKELGITVMRFTNDEVFNDLESVLSKISKQVLELQKK